MSKNKLRKYALVVAVSVVLSELSVVAEAAAVLTWIQPTTYDDATNTPLPTGAVVSNTVYRDGKVLKVLTPAVTTYTDSSITDCAQHTYYVTASTFAESKPSASIIASVICAPKSPTGLTVITQ